MHESKVINMFDQTSAEELEWKVWQIATSAVEIAERMANGVVLSPNAAEWLDDAILTMGKIITMAENQRAASWHKYMAKISSSDTFVTVDSVIRG